MRESKKIEKITKILQKEIKSVASDITSSVKNGNFSNGDINDLKNIITNLKECCNKMIKAQDNVMRVYDFRLADWWRIYQMKKGNAKSIGNYLSMWFVQRRIIQLTNKLSYAYAIESIFEFIIKSMDDISNMIDRNINSAD